MSDLAVEVCDPRALEGEIKDLFARNGKPEFDNIFERAYRVRAPQGLRSWVGLSGGRAVMHISVTPMRFVGGGRTSMSGLLGDLMVDEEHRDFWAPMKLVRRMVADVKREGAIDFLLSTAVAEAEGIFKAAGFKPFANIRRFVLPLYLPYLAVARLRGRVRRRAARVSAFAALSVRDAAGALQQRTHWRPQPDPTFYATRIDRIGFMDEQWLDVPPRRGGDGGCAMLSVKGDAPAPEVNLADAFWADDGVRLGEVVHAAARYARRQRYRKLSIATLEEAAIAQELQKSGFFARDFMSALLINQITANAPPSPEHWFLPGFALSSW